MTLQHASQFLEKVETDPNFRNQLLSAHSPEAKREILQGAKLNFTRNEYHQAINERWHSELNPEEMQNIVAAGGSGPCSDPQTMEVVCQTDLFLED